jgi:hypothetical protein
MAAGSGRTSRPTISAHPWVEGDEIVVAGSGATGGDAPWLVDARSVVRRIGTPLTGPQPIPLAWNAWVNQPPFALDIVGSTPVLDGGELLVVDDGGRLLHVDPRTGAARFEAQADVEAVRVEPVLAGDLLLVTPAGGLHAIRTDDGSTAWTVAGGTPVQPSLVAGNVVLWSGALAGSQSGARASSQPTSPPARSCGSGPFPKRRCRAGWLSMAAGPSLPHLSPPSTCRPV